MPPPLAGASGVFASSPTLSLTNLGTVRKMRRVVHSLPKCLLALMSSAQLAWGAALPPHEPLSVLVIADAVNPHGLSPSQLTEPQDIAPALSAEDSGLSLREVNTIDSQCVDQGLAMLESETRPNVLLYFAHRAARLCDGGDAQSRLVLAAEQGLLRGMGIVALHHGLYGDLYTPGAKDAMLELLGAEASGLTWDQVTGQRVFLVGRDHFVSSNGLVATGTADVEAFAGIEPGSYPYFDNIPDERYPETNLFVVEGEVREPLFATNSGGNRLLGYALRRAGWLRPVVVYQPGEYQPHALDDRSGNNFQILVNALYFAALDSPTAPEPTNGSNDAPSTTDAPGTSESSTTDGHESTPGAASTERDTVTGRTRESRDFSEAWNTTDVSHHESSNSAPAVVTATPGVPLSAPLTDAPLTDAPPGASSTRPVAGSRSSGCATTPLSRAPCGVVWWLGGLFAWIVRRRHEQRSIVSRNAVYGSCSSETNGRPRHASRTEQPRDTGNARAENNQR